MRSKPEMINAIGQASKYLGMPVSDELAAFQGRVARREAAAGLGGQYYELTIRSALCALYPNMFIIAPIGGAPLAAKCHARHSAHFIASA